MTHCRGVFVTGTDTGVGKTLVATAMLRAFAAAGLRAAGMKPVATGTRTKFRIHPNDDVEALLEASNVDAPIAVVNPYCFEPAVAPHLAAAAAGMHISLERVRECYEGLRRRADRVVVEGAGGLLVPLGDGMDWGDVVRALDIPVVLVVGVRLGCLNHALLTAEALQKRNLRTIGWVANRIDPHMPLVDENIQTLRRMLSVPLLGNMPHAPDPAQASRAFDLALLDPKTA